MQCKLFAKKKNSLRHILLLLTLSLFTFSGCKTTPKVGEEVIYVPSYEIAEDLSFMERQEPYKYIFIRLYDVDYINPFYIANILKFGITLTEVNDVEATHAAMNFTLDDNFYGLTSGGEFELSREACMNTKANKFLKKCDPEDSTQITYAIRVTDEEYEKAKKIVEFYAGNEETHYDVLSNFKIAHFAAKRRWHTKVEDRSMEKMEYPEIDEKEEKIKTDFVCSTFVAFVLKESIEYIDNWFTDNEINYNYVGVSDIPSIPGVVRLFSSPFYEYDLAVEAFLEKYPEFNKYYSLESIEVINP